MKKKCASKKAARITIRNLTRRRIPASYLIRKIALKVLRLERVPDAGLSITYVNDTRISKLNLRYRGKDSPTDVLAFSAREGKHIKGENNFLGDIVISLDTAYRQARYFNSTKNRELKLYLIHGILHLLGYDDETKADFKRMKAHQERLFGKIKL